MDLHGLLPYLSLINIPVAIGVFRVARSIGKWVYIAESIEKRCCLFTMGCPLHKEDN